MDGSGNVTAVNTFGGAGLLSQHTASGSTFYAFDERGNVAQRLDATGTPQSTDLYDGYGQRASTAASQPDPFGFGGQDGYYTDNETGLVLCGHRFYDSGAGRFLNRDPSGYAGGINLYQYSRNNPVSFFDPSGDNPKSVTDGAIAFIALANYILGPVGQNFRNAILRTPPSIEQPFKVSDQATEGPLEEESQLAETIEADEESALSGDMPDQDLPDLINPEKAVEDIEDAVKEGAEGGAEETSLGAGTAGEAGGLALGPVVIIAGGVVAIGDLAHYGATGRPTGPFTAIGQRLADALIPDPGTTVTPTAPVRNNPCGN